MSEITAGKHKIGTSNEDKVFFPGEGYTKGDLIEYYRKAAKYIVPYMKQRPISMLRYPDGIQKSGFYQKQAGKHFPDWIDTISVKIEDGRKKHVIVNEEATLVYLADQAVVTPHIWLSRKGNIRKPDLFVFDLDPPDGESFSMVRDAAKYLIELFEEIKLNVYAQVTGAVGIHIVIPIKPEAAYDRVRRFARDVADFLANEHPDSLTTEVRKNKRKGRLFLDTARNAYGQTIIAPYCVKPHKGAPVATPVSLDEISNSSLRPNKYNIKNIFRRLSRKDDPWNGMFRAARKLGPAQKRFEKLK